MGEKKGGERREDIVRYRMGWREVKVVDGWASWPEGWRAKGASCFDWTDCLFIFWFSSA